MPTAAQRPQFEAIIAGPHDRAAMFRMLTLMTDKQIEVVGW
jgi:hypothetical protein